MLISVSMLPGDVLQEVSQTEKIKATGAAFQATIGHAFLLDSALSAFNLMASKYNCFCRHDSK